jgi:hypothetical protein
VVNNLEKFNDVYFPLIKELEGHAGDSFRFNGYNEIAMRLEPKLIGILASKGGFPRQMYMELNEKFQKIGFSGSLGQQFLLMGIPVIKIEL